MNELFYTKEHEWVQKISDTEAHIGITEYAQKELGEIVFVEVTTIGEVAKAMDVIGSVEAVKTVADIHIPVDGKILEVNENLENCPELVNSDAECEGWIARIEISSDEDFKGLMTEEEYIEYLKTL